MEKRKEQLIKLFKDSPDATGLYNEPSDSLSYYRVNETVVFADDLVVSIDFADFIPGIYQTIKSLLTETKN